MSKNGGKSANWPQCAMYDDSRLEGYWTEQKEKDKASVTERPN